MIATIGLMLFYFGATITIVYIFLAQCYIINRITTMITENKALSIKIERLHLRNAKVLESLTLIMSASTTLIERHEKLEDITKNLIDAHNQNTLTIVDCIEAIKRSHNHHIN